MKYYINPRYFQVGGEEEEQEDSQQEIPIEDMPLQPYQPEQVADPTWFLRPLDIKQQEEARDPGYATRTDVAKLLEMYDRNKKEKSNNSLENDERELTREFINEEVERRLAEREEANQSRENNKEDNSDFPEPSPKDIEAAENAKNDNTEEESTGLYKNRYAGLLVDSPNNDDDEDGEGGTGDGSSENRTPSTKKLTKIFAQVELGGKEIGDHKNGAIDAFGFRQTGRLADAWKTPEYADIRKQFGNDYNAFYNTLKSGKNPQLNTVNNELYAEWLDDKFPGDLAAQAKYNYGADPNNPAQVKASIDYVNNILKAAAKLDSVVKNKQTTDINLTDLPKLNNGIIDATKYNSFNFGKLKEKKGLILHHSAVQNNYSVGALINTFKERGFPAQYIIDREGNIIQYLPTGAKGQHIKPGEGKYNFLNNSNTEGVEIIAKDDSDVLPIQQQAALKLAKTLGYTPSQVFTHGQINSHKQTTEGKTALDYIQNNFQVGGEVDDEYEENDMQDADYQNMYAQYAQQQEQEQQEYYNSLMGGFANPDDEEGEYEEEEDDYLEAADDEGY